MREFKVAVYGIAVLSVLVAGVAIMVVQKESRERREPWPQITVTRVCGSEDDGLDDGMTPCLVDCDPGEPTAKWCRPDQHGTWLRQPVNVQVKVAP